MNRTILNYSLQSANVHRNMMRSLERRIVRTVLGTLLENGFSLRVLGDGIETIDLATICTRLFHTAEETVLVRRKDVANGSYTAGTVRFTHGQGFDMYDIDINASLGRSIRQITERIADLHKEVGHVA